jgi:hypothetical protein
VQLTVVSDADMTGGRYRMAGVTIVALALAVVAVLYGGVLQRTPSNGRSPVTVSANIGPDVLVGPDAVAASFRESLRCQTLTYAAGDRAYFRAQPNRSGDCRQSSPGRPVIYREVGREFRAVLDASDYSCPVRSLPVIVQQQLGLCPRDR